MKVNPSLQLKKTVSKIQKFNLNHLNLNPKMLKLKDYTVIHSTKNEIVSKKNSYIQQQNRSRHSHCNSKGKNNSVSKESVNYISYHSYCEKISRKSSLNYSNIMFKDYSKNLKKRCSNASIEIRKHKRNLEIETSNNVKSTTTKSPYLSKIKLIQNKNAISKEPSFKSIETSNTNLLTSKKNHNQKKSIKKIPSKIYQEKGELKDEKKKPLSNSITSKFSQNNRNRENEKLSLRNAKENSKII